MKTVEHFMPVFFRELRRDGQIDRAMSARGSRCRIVPTWQARCCSSVWRAVESGTCRASRESQTRNSTSGPAYSPPLPRGRSACRSSVPACSIAILAQPESSRVAGPNGTISRLPPTRGKICRRWRSTSGQL